MLGNISIKDISHELGQVFGMQQKFDIPSLGAPYKDMQTPDGRKNLISRGQLRRIIQVDHNNNPCATRDQTSCLTGEIIDYYLGAVCSYANTAAGCPKWEEGGTPLLYSTLGTHFFPELTCRGVKSEEVTRILAKNNLDGSKILNAEHIFIPVNVKNSHWTLLVVSPKIKMIAYLDSYSDNRLNYYYMDNQTIGPIIRLLRYHGRDGFSARKWHFYSRDIPKQDNFSDSGVFLLAYAQSLAFGTNLGDVTHTERLQNRALICCTILRGGFKGVGAPSNINVVRVDYRRLDKTTDYKRGTSYSIKLLKYKKKFPTMEIKRRSYKSTGQVHQKTNQEKETPEDVASSSNLHSASESGDSGSYRKAANAAIVPSTSGRTPLTGIPTQAAKTGFLSRETGNYESRTDNIAPAQMHIPKRATITQLPPASDRTVHSLENTAPPQMHNPEQATVTQLPPTPDRTLRSLEDTAPQMHNPERATVTQLPPIVQIQNYKTTQENCVFNMWPADNTTTNKKRPAEEEREEPAKKMKQTTA